MESGILTVSSEKDLAERSMEFFEEHVTHVGKLPVEWMAAWLKDKGQGALTDHVLDDVDGNDPEAILHLFYVVTGFSPRTPVPT